MPSLLEDVLAAAKTSTEQAPMYDEFYRLNGKPFKLTPDKRFFFDSQVHHRAMAYLRYGLEQGEGFIVITGGIGTGKTMLVQTLFSELQERNIMAAQLVTTQIEPEDMLRMVCASFGLAHEGMNKATLLHNLEVVARTCFSEGKRILLVVDEAQNLPARSIEEMRMLANFQVDGRSLFQSFLLGQHQLRSTLLGPDMEQLRQRIIASYHLEPLTEEETKSYIEYRLVQVGWDADPRLDEGVFAGVYSFTEGVPRRINALCDRLFLYGCIEEKHALSVDDLKVVQAELRREVGHANRPVAEETGAGAPALDVGEPEAVQRFGSANERPRSPRLVRLDTGARGRGQITRRESEPEGDTSVTQRLAKLEADVKGLKQTVQRERKLLRRALLLQLDFEAEDDFD